MIKKVQITSGYLSQMPATGKGRVIEFNDKFNVLFGTNGSGKSSLLKVLGAYTGIQTGGWSNIVEPSKLAYDKPEHIPFCYRNFSPGQCDAIVDWDGRPTFYNDSDSVNKNDTTWFFASEKQSFDGITSESEQLDIMANKPSSGQYRIHKINKIMQIIRNPPDLTKIPMDIVNKQLAQLQVDYIQRLPKNGKITLLLDEPEKALALPKQFELLETLFKLSEYFQIIIATHSPFVLFENANIIDMEPNYSSTCIDLIEKRVKKKAKSKK